ncbi:MAG: mannosyltransferase family protein [Acidimicrobiia bacterium]
MRAAISKYHAVLYPLGVYAFTRVLFGFATFTGPQLSTPQPELRAFVTRWDAVYYLSLVRNGYPDVSYVTPEHAFFPLYPMTVRVADFLLPQSDFAAALAVSFAAGASASVLFWRLATRLADRATADRAVLVFCLFPGSIVFQWPYADALLIALMCGAICLLVEGRWLSGACVAALATATRPSGVALVIACAAVAYAQVSGSRTRRLVAAAGSGAIAVSGFVAFVAWLGRYTGNQTQWFDVEREVFGEGTPWRRLVATINDIFTEGAHWHRLMVVAFALLALVVLAVGVTARQPFWAVSITVVALYFAITANIASSSPRLQLAAIPAFVAFGGRLRDTWLLMWCTGSAVLGVTLIFVYGMTTWFAP